MKKSIYKEKLFWYLLVDIYQDSVHAECKLTRKEAAAKNYGYAINGSTLRYQKI